MLQVGAGDVRVGGASDRLRRPTGHRDAEGADGCGGASLLAVEVTKVAGDVVEGLLFVSLQDPDPPRQRLTLEHSSRGPCALRGSFPLAGLLGVSLHLAAGHVSQGSDRAGDADPRGGGIRAALGTPDHAGMRVPAWSG